MPYTSCGSVCFSIVGSTSSVYFLLHFVCCPDLLYSFHKKKKTPTSYVCICVHSKLYVCRGMGPGMYVEVWEWALSVPFFLKRSLTHDHSFLTYCFLCTLPLF
eukprot:NODE_1344_length_557_cov_78.169291_g1269_i0.p3 GENE.NODE_1344_length_557_cov_78.169291_g1269_i0~~NODE_1344_length_557_cov_78.169291_g1269_i0.p3  ORF type:complete len:103 (-),score=2.84 NODE_1344_length_557_cov_78.169291_g1269_i0:53-361(-)